MKQGYPPFFLYMIFISYNLCDHDFSWIVYAGSGSLCLADTRPACMRRGQRAWARVPSTTSACH